MSTPIMRSSYASDLLPIITKWTDEELKKQEDLTSKLFDVRKSDKAYETYGVSMPFSVLQRKDEGESIRYDKSKQLYTPRFTHQTYALGFKISMEAMQDGSIMKNGKAGSRYLARSTAETKNILAANVINNGYTSGVTQDGGDGAILFTASHTTPVGNQTNIITAADLSEAALETMYIAITTAQNNRGIRANLKPVKLAISPTEMFNTQRILYSEKRNGTPDNDLNAVDRLGMFPGGVIMSPYLTDSDQWSVITDALDGLVAHDRYESPVETDNEFDTKNASFSKIIRVSHGWIEFRGIYGSAGA